MSSDGSDVPWRPVNLDASHGDEIRALFAQVFGSTMSEALWRWKYADGRGRATGTRDRNGRLLAHYGGTGRTLLVQGQPIPAVQLGDVMVAADARGFLSRNGPFTVATQRFLQQYIGQDQAFALGFGFPNARAGRLGEKLGLYVGAEQVQEVVWPCTNAMQHRPWWRRSWHTAPVDWSLAQTAKQLDQLWQTMQSQTSGFVIGQRDAAWWTHRYANHPEQGYRCFWLRQRLTGRIWGTLALKPATTQGQAWELLDWIAPVPQIAIVVQAARAIAAQTGNGSGLQSWLSAPLVALLGNTNPKARLLEGASLHTACMACVTLRQRPSLPALTKLPWWLTGGDTDFR